MKSNIPKILILCTIYLFSFSKSELRASSLDNEPGRFEFFKSRLYQITNKSNEIFLGTIQTNDVKGVLVKTDYAGGIYISKDEILEVELVTDKKKKLSYDSHVAGAFASRYIINSSALPVAKGQSFAALNLYGPEVNFALTNNLSVGLVSTWIASPFMVNAVYRFTTPAPKVNFSLGASVGTSGYFYKMRTWGGYYYGNMTLGSHKTNFTIGAGYQNFLGVQKRVTPIGIQYDSKDEFNNARRYVSMKPLGGASLTLSGVTRITPKISILFDGILSQSNNNGFETKVISGSDGKQTYETIENKHGNSSVALMLGMRFQRRENSAIQFSLHKMSLHGFNINNSFDNFVLPSCSWFVNF